MSETTSSAGRSPSFSKKNTGTSPTYSDADSISTSVPRPTLLAAPSSSRTKAYRGCSASYQSSVSTSVPSTSEIHTLPKLTSVCLAKCTSSPACPLFLASSSRSLTATGSVSAGICIQSPVSMLPAPARTRIWRIPSFATPILLTLTEGSVYLSSSSTLLNVISSGENRLSSTTACRAAGREASVLPTIALSPQHTNGRVSSFE